jgi:hypothetical protein
MHCGESRRDEIARAIEALDGTADIVLLAGDPASSGRNTIRSSIRWV